MSWFNSKPKPNFDDLFGKVRINPNMEQKVLEQVQPKSFQILDQNSAKLLSAMMESTSKGLKLAQKSFELHKILWVIDESGNLSFALEELIDSVSQEFVAPWCKLLPREGNIFYNGEIKDVFRLGHPALVEGKPARIAGEIYFDDGEWVMTNHSGRYGYDYGFGRNEEHLLNACKVFERFNIRLNAFYFKPRGDI